MLKDDVAFDSPRLDSVFPVDVLVLAGTRKGLFLLRGGENRREWKVEEPLLPGWSVYHAMLDPRDGTLYAAANNFVYGATVQRSKDLGKTWERAEALGLPEDGELKLNALWHVEPGHESRPKEQAAPRS